MVTSIPVNRCPVKGCMSGIKKTDNLEKTGDSDWRWTCILAEHQDIWFYGQCWHCNTPNASHNKCGDCGWFICSNRNCKACTKEGCSRNNYETIKGKNGRHIVKADPETKAWLTENMPKLQDPHYAKEHEKIIKDRSLYLYTYNGHMKFPEIGGVLGKTLDKEKHIEP